MLPHAHHKPEPETLHMKSARTLTYLKDYRPPSHRILNTRMELDLDPVCTRVRTLHTVERCSESTDPLVLDHEEITIESIRIDGESPQQEAISYTDHQIRIAGLPVSCQLEIVNTLNPSTNSKLEGLYQSRNLLCTQCEAEGFRRITPSIDRPDNLATYQVLLRGPAKRYPVLLSNGNLVRQEIQHGIHETEWSDPFPKPTYLFAIVAGNLACRKDRFLTRSGREVSLHIYAAEADLDKCEFPMQALQRAMEWDEQAFGREYDLDLFNIVAVEDFNMGAMENKSLNVFNIKLVLASPEVSTDSDYDQIESVIGHEYFHNWSGNRVTCRDWFQLSLKEGFTVFRDQEFSAAMGSAGLQRIEDVDLLRSHQFPEDAGPLAHPVRPESYLEINNFYTSTVYEKGAEVVRMLQTLVGEQAFRKGTDLYFDRHDGQAVTTDDFVAAIQESLSEEAPFDFSAFKRWYSQAGTPVVHAEGTYDAKASQYTLTLRQSCPELPNQSNALAFVIPIVIALLDSDGQIQRFADGTDEKRLILSTPEQQFVFNGIQKPPIPSLLRRFSAPVKLEIDRDPSELVLLFQHDTDPFVRWDAGQQLLQNEILQNLARVQSGEPCQFDDTIVGLMGNLIQSSGDDLSLGAKLLTLPDESWLGQLSKPIDPISIAQSRHSLMQQVATVYFGALMDRYRSLEAENHGGPGKMQSGIRALRDTCLRFLSTIDTKEVHDLARTQLANARILTDRSSALQAITQSSMPDRVELLDGFYDDWKHEVLVVNRWLGIQAAARQANILSRMNELTQHPAFDARNPNKVYSLLLVFAARNPIGFHMANGEGYRFLTDWIIQLDEKNPMVAARLVSKLTPWQDMVPALGEQMKACLTRIQQVQSLSPDVSEIVTRGLTSGQGVVSA